MYLWIETRRAIREVHGSLFLITSSLQCVILLSVHALEGAAAALLEPWAAS